MILAVSLIFYIGGAIAFLLSLYAIREGPVYEPAPESIERHAGHELGVEIAVSDLRTTETHDALRDYT
jgi:hypothetical protein